MKALVFFRVKIRNIHSRRTEETVGAKRSKANPSVLSLTEY